MDYAMLTLVIMSGGNKNDCAQIEDCKSEGGGGGGEGARRDATPDGARPQFRLSVCVCLCVCVCNAIGAA